MAALEKTLVTSAIFAAGLHATPIGPNLIANGSFESGPITHNMVIGSGSTVITGWTTINSGVEYFQPAFWGMGAAQHGSYAVDLDNYTYPSGGLQQTFATSAGQAYELVFWGATMRDYGRDGTGNIQVLLDGSLAGNFAVSNPTAILAWQQFTLGFVAAGSSTTLAFAANENPFLHFANIDNVVVGLASGGAPAVPEPSSLALMAVAAGLFAVFGRKRRAAQAGEPR